MTEPNVLRLYNEGYDNAEYLEIENIVRSYEAGEGGVLDFMGMVIDACLCACGDEEHTLGLFWLVLHMNTHKYYQQDKNRILAYALSFDVKGEYQHWFKELVEGEK